jgi:hypothetical protein
MNIQTRTPKAVAMDILGLPSGEYQFEDAIVMVEPSVNQAYCANGLQHFVTLVKAAMGLPESFLTQAGFTIVEMVPVADSKPFLNAV